MPASSPPLRRLPLFLALCLVIGNFFLHLPISDVCDWARARWGFPLYDRAALIGIPLLTAAGLIPLLRRERARWRHLRTWCVALSLLVMSLAAQRWMLVANVEIIHFPQFGLIAGLLLAAGQTGEAAWLLATAAGILDETYQQYVIYAGRADTYLDFNDMILNALGAAWVVVVFARSTQMRPSGWLRWSQALRWLLPLVALALVLFPPHVTPFLRPSAGFRLYRVIGPGEALAWATLLWGLVWLSTTPNRSRPPGAGSRAPSRSAGTGQYPPPQSGASAPPGIAEAMPSTSTGFVAEPTRRYRSRVPALLIALLLASGGCAMRHHVASAPGASPFITTFWCGPPLNEIDDARAAEIAAAGFTVIGAPCEGMINAPLNRRALDVAARHGLGMWIMDHRYNPLTREAVDPAAIAAAVADYRHHPAFAGYFVVDEPTADQFARVKDIVDNLHRLDPAHVAYVNLLPDYTKPDGLQTAGYVGYVDEFISAIGPRLLSYDYYPFGKEKDRSTFFNNLTLMRDRALRQHVPLLVIVLAMPHGPYREPSEAELAWQVFHALAFGARGISYFAYWTPVNVEHAEEMQFRYGLIEGGRPTALYFHARRINREIRAIAEQLAGYRSVAVADARGEVAAPLPIGPLDGIDGGAITVGFFAHADGHIAAILVNRDYRYGAHVTLRPRAGRALPEVFDPATGRWSALASADLVLPPGYGRLLRWRE